MGVNFLEFVLKLTQAFTLLLPITVGGLTLILCMRKGWLRSLDVPLDGGLTLGGMPLVGKSKSLRSLAIYTLSAILVCSILNFLAGSSDFVSDIYQTSPVILGPEIALSYLAGEILNSFVKRRMGIATSGNSSSWLGIRLQSFFDNVDGIISCGALFILVYQVQAIVLATSFVLSVLMHLSTDLLMRRLSLKTKQ
jgi:hypothetical protein